VTATAQFVRAKMATVPVISPLFKSVNTLLLMKIVCLWVRVRTNKTTWRRICSSHENITKPGNNTMRAVLSMMCVLSVSSCVMFGLLSDHFQRPCVGDRRMALSVTPWIQQLCIDYLLMCPQHSVAVRVRDDRARERER